MIFFIKESLASFGVGLSVGILFAILKLPIPAPPVVPAVFGIFGITIGFLIIKKFFV